MGKIQNDKYYTPIPLANYCWDRVLNIIGEENISEIIEPSVGDGSFLHHTYKIPHFAFDIEPECNSDTTHIFKDSSGCACDDGSGNTSDLHRRDRS